MYVMVTVGAGRCGGKGTVKSWGSCPGKGDDPDRSAGGAGTGGDNFVSLIGSLTTGFWQPEGNAYIATSLAQGEMEGLLGGFNRPQEAPADYRINTRIEDNGDGTENIIVVVGWGDEGAKEKEIRLCAVEKGDKRACGEGERGLPSWKR